MGLGSLCAKSFMAGALIGALQGAIGYFPQSDTALIALEASIVGAVIATVLALVFYQVAFRDFNIAPVFRVTVWLSGISGVISALIARISTHGEGATVSAIVTPIIAIITATVMRVRSGCVKTDSHPAPH